MQIDAVVINASPLITLFRSEQAHLLPQLFNRIIVPQAVWQEVVLDEWRYAAALDLRKQTWPVIEETEISARVAAWSLGAGETAVYVLVLCCPNDPDDAKLLSDVAGAKIDEVFIGSCMTNIGHFRAASKLLEGKRDIPVKLWIAPPTKMDAAELTREGHYGVFGAAGARTEMPGCSLCMGNQAQVREGATVVSTSTRNFPNRLGKNTNVYLASAELAAIASKLGRIPTVAEYQADMGVINKDGSKIYQYLNFDQIEEYADVAKGVTA